MRFILATLGLASAASAHTLFSTFFVNGENQGEGTCVRRPADGKTSTSPIYPLNGDVMACGREGNDPVPYVCPTPGGATLTFEFREWPNGQKSGSIAQSHKGPCSVYVKKVDDMFSDSASGPGWFKIWEDGYDADSDKWCVDKLIDNKGLLSVELPAGLPSGYYLVRPEILALHSAFKGDPQFFHSCAQVFIEEGPDVDLNIPEDREVSIPGYIKSDNPGITFNLYQDDPKDYEIPGPKVYIPESSAKGSKGQQKDGLIPRDCLIKNGNWCAKPVPESSDVESCWDSVDNCWDQSKECWDSVPLTGGRGCEVWADYCKKLGNNCEAKKYDGPAEFDGEEQFLPLPGPIPKSYNNVFDGTEVTSGDASGGGDDSSDSNDDKGSDDQDNSGNGGQTGKPEPVVQTLTVPSAPAPTATETPSEDDKSGELKVSKDGHCGGQTGQTCKGSSFGDCCSRKGKCGRKTRHCACGCQSLFGDCR